MMQREMVSVFVGLGANLGNAQGAIMQAIESIGKLPNTQLIRCSSFYRSAPVDAAGPDYINAVLHIESRINAYDLLNAFQNIENLAGRERPYLNAPRTLDVDMLLFGCANIVSQRLTVPHPRMLARAFVLRPLSELAPHLVSDVDLRKLDDQQIKKM
jgi:2-amino-4-hydroxy-6-hydroxymethyldihydropteridine diphosphokinase